MRLRRAIAMTVGVAVIVVAIALAAVALTAPRKDSTGLARDLEEALKSDQTRAVILLVLVGATTFIAGFGVRDGIGRLAQRSAARARAPRPGGANRGQ